MKLRIDYIFFMYSLKIGGGNKLFIHIANELAKFDKHRVSIHYLFDVAKNQSLIDNINERVSINRYFSERGRLFSLVNALNKLKKLQKIFVVSDPAVISFLTLSNIKYVRFIQGDDYHLFDAHPKFNAIMLTVYKLLQRISYRKKFIYYLVNSDFVKECIMSKPYNIYKKNIYPVNIRPALVETYFSIPVIKKYSPTCIIGTVGRVCSSKGFKYFVELKNKLFAEKEKCEFKVLAPDDLANFNTENMAIFRAKNDNECINFYDQCDIFISTSLTEGFGMPPLEAMARGCACVLFDCAAFREYAVNNKNAIIIPVGDKHALFNAVSNLINNPVLRNELGRAAVQTAKKFNWKDTALNFKKAIESIQMRKYDEEL